MGLARHSVRPHHEPMGFLRQVVALHEGFFENDITNKATMAFGFVVSAVCIALVFVLY